MRSDPGPSSYPLSPMQAGMLYHGLQDEHSGVDMEQILVDLAEPLDAAGLRRAWEKVVWRHAILRTCFAWEDVEVPQQVVRDEVVLPFVELDWRGRSAAERERSRAELLERDRGEGFDFSRAPLMRLTLVRWDTEDYSLLWTFHHALLDGRSFPIVLQEVFQFYKAGLSGMELVLPEPPLYRNYIDWLQEKDFDRSRGFWTELLRGFTTPTPFGVDRDPHQRLHHKKEYREQSLSLPADETSLLRGFAERQNVTPNTLVQGAWALLLSCYSGEEDLVFGATRACRTNTVPGANDMVGIFINTLPLRVAVDPAKPLIPWLMELRSQWTALRDHEHTPLTAIQGWSGLRAGQPMFESIVVFENYLLNTRLRAQGGEWQNRTFTYYGQTNFPITLIGYLDAELRLLLGYDRQRFADDTITRMLGHLRTLLMGMAQNPEARIGDLVLLTEPERHQLIEEWNPTAEFPADVCIHELVAAQAARRPEATALVCENDRLTYRELEERSNRLARHLRSLGVGPESLVALCLERSVNLVVAVLAVLKAGGAYLPLDLAYPPERLAFMLEDARARVLLTQESLKAKAPRLDDLRVVLLDTEAEAIGRNDASAPESGARPANAAYVIYTSGSTGKPKGVVVTHANVVRLFRATEPWFSFDESDVWTLFHSYAFDFSVWEIWGALIYGGRLVVVPYLTSRSPEAFYEILRTEGVTVLNQTPSAFQQLVQYEETAGLRRELALRYIVFGGEALELQSLRPWFDRHGDRKPQLVNMYGITETTVHVTYRPLSLADLEGAPGSVIGVPIPDLELYVLNRRLQPVPIGVAGEIYVGGAGVARGYLNRDQLTAERFIPHLFKKNAAGRLYKTGDVGRFLPGRDLEYLGRADDQVKIRGFRIELGEIESVLSRHPRVRKAVVIARPSAAGGKRLVAYLVYDQEGAPSVPELRAFLQNQLPDYMLPSAFVALPQLPLTPNGKVDRKMLPEPEPERPDLGRQYTAPRNAVEAALARIWSEVLRLDRVGIHDNFFEIGGDSILSIQIMARARRAGLRLKPQHLFRHPTVAELAAAAEVRDDTAAAPDNAEGDVPFTPIQRWFLEQDLADAHHYNQAFLFETAEGLDRPALEKALREVGRHHDAMRLRLVRAAAGARQFYSPSEEPVPLTWVDAGSDPEPDRHIATEAAAAQASLDLEKGPLWRAVYFDKGPGRLLLVVHHLAVDGVSWRPLLEDLETAYGQIRKGQDVRLPAKTTSFKAWAVRMKAYASGDAVRRELPYWEAVTDPQRAAEAAMPASPTGASAENTEGSSTTFDIRLSPEETDSLIQRVPAAYNTQINDVLLAALGRGWARFSGRSALFTDLEGHGREHLFEDADVSRTVGWFTSLFPVRLEKLETGKDWKPGEALKSVKEQLRRIPGHGLGYGVLRYLTPGTGLEARPEPALVFNYLGRFDQILADSKLFRMAREDGGPWHGPRQRRRYALEINGLVVDGRLELRWTYNRLLHIEADVRRFAGEVAAALRELISHCLSAEAGGRTPSDFPLSGLDQAALDRLVGNRRDVEDIYPLSPIQALYYSATPGAVQTGFDQWHCTFHGDLDAAALRQAWKETLQRHPVLRSTIHDEGLAEPVQIVHRGVEPPWTVEEWPDLPADQAAARWAGFLEQDRARPLSLVQAPAMRMALIRLDRRTWKFLWSVPALLVDGWSWPIIFRDVSRAYEAISGKVPFAAEPVRPYRDYLQWLHNRTPEAGREFWRKTLAGFKEPTPLPGEAPGPRSGGDRFAEAPVPLPEDAGSSLNAAARRLQITLNAFVQGAWALLLSRQSGRRDVVFGSAFSGRPADLPGVESIVGPFVNNLPIRVAMDEALSGTAFLRGMHGLLQESAPFQFTPLLEIQGVSEVPWRHRLFDSLIVFQNYAVDDSARRLGGRVDIADFSGPIHTNFPLLLLAEPGEALKLTLIYDREKMAASTIERWGRDLAALLERMPAGLDEPVAEWLKALSPPAADSRPARLRMRAASQDYVPPQTDLERTIAELWQGLFDVEKVGVEENFFDLGGHSLLLLRMYARLREILNIEFPVVTLFEYPTVRSLAKHLGRPDGPGAWEGEGARDRAEKQKKAVTQMRKRFHK